MCGVVMSQGACHMLYAQVLEVGQINGDAAASM